MEVSVRTKTTIMTITLPTLDPKLNKSPVKHRFIASSSKCTTKRVFQLVNQNTYSYKDWTSSIKTTHTGCKKIGGYLKNSTNLLSSLGHSGVHKATSIQTFDFFYPVHFHPT